MKLKRWVEYLKQLEDTTSRNRMMEVLSDMLRETTAEEVDKLVYLLLGRLGPLYDNPQFALAEKQIVKSLVWAFKKDGEEVTRMYKKIGDLGEVARQLGVSGEGKSIEVVELFDKLMEVALDEGAGSQERKIHGLADIIKNVDCEEAKYVVRMVSGKLRLGFSDKTVLDALSHLEEGDKSLRERLDVAYSIRPDVGWLVKTVKNEGMEVAEKEKARVGVPIMPMLCQRLKTAKEMIKKMGRVAVEPKFDGTRVLVHFDATNKVRQLRTFTRNLDENSWMFPELARMGEHVKAKQLILDCEACGYDAKSGKLLPFQLTITRKRKHGIEEQATKVPLRFYVFDVLFKDGVSLIDEVYEKRRQILKETILDKELLVMDDYWVTDDPRVILEKHQMMLDQGLEGVVVKKMGSKYVPGRTGWRWVKMKEVEEARAKLADTLDCVVMGFNAGKGKRTQFGLGAFLVGVAKGGQIVTVAKIGTGLSDEQFREMKKKLDKAVVNNKPSEYVVDKALVPDVWVEPKVIVEIAADEITKSPIHSAGVALRFPRLVRFREDKGLDQITTVEEVKEL